MGLFKSKAEKEAEKKLDGIIQRLEMNMANNYKDNAQDNLKELEAALDTIRTEGSLKKSFIAKYESILDDFRAEMKGYSHKDQKPYWH